LLTDIGGLDKETTLITNLGKEMENFPVHPRFSKMIIFGKKVLSYVIPIVSGLTVNQLFVDLNFDNEKESEEKTETKEESEKSKEKKKKYRSSRELWSNDKSDLLSILKVVGAYEYCDGDIERKNFCQNNFVNEKNMKEVSSLRKQLIKIMLKFDKTLEKELKRDLTPPSIHYI
jgi:ATP-dependent RNA helicase DHX37/DHR1